MVVVERRLTPEDLARMLDSGELEVRDIYKLELLDGEVVRLPPPGHRHSAVIAAIMELLFPFARRIGARVDPAGIAFRLGQNVRSPDVALTLKEHRNIFGPHHIWGIQAPDLAVEVLSPDQYGEPYARQKVPEYLSNGARVVWLVNPENRTVRVFEAGSDEVRVYSGDAEITLDELAPGFRAPISAFFPEE